MQRPVVIAGVGLTKHVGYDVERSWKEMFAQAAFEALDDCGVGPEDLEGGVVAFHGESMTGAGNIGPLVADAVGMDPAGVTGISAACSGGAIALYHACALVGSGICDTALAGGFEKGSDLYEYMEAITPSSEAEYDYAFGLTHLDWLALMNLRYRDKYELKSWEAAVRWIGDRHRFARQHPKSFYYGQKMPSDQEIRNNKMFWASARADGAAAVVVTTAERARRLGRKPISVDGLGYANASAYLPHRFEHAWQEPGEDIGDSAVTRVAAERAFNMAGLGDPAEIDLLQVADGAPAIAFMELEALGFYPRGTAWEGVLAGNHGADGRTPTNTHGGSMAFGHASGAAALAAVIETVVQLRGEAGDRQLDRVLRVGVCQASGGSNSNNTVLVLRAQSDD